MQMGKSTSRSLRYIPTSPHWESDIRKERAAVLHQIVRSRADKTRHEGDERNLGYHERGDRPNHERGDGGDGILAFPKIAML